MVLLVLHVTQLTHDPLLGLLERRKVLPRAPRLTLLRQASVPSVGRSAAAEIKVGACCSG